MKNTLFFLLILTSFAAGSPDHPVWTEGTAFATATGIIEAGLGSPWSLGLNSRTEITSYVLFDPLVPGAGIKRQWLTGPRLYLCTTHSVYSPTPLLHVLSRKGTGGIVPPDDKIPMFIASGDYVLASVPLHEALAVTLRIGGNFCGSTGANTLETIDYFMAYARSAAFFTGYSFDAGIDLRGRIWRCFHYRFDSDLFLMPGMKGSWETEQTGLVLWQWRSRIAIAAGMRYVVGEFPFGVDWMIFPLADVRMSFGKGKK